MAGDQGTRSLGAPAGVSVLRDLEGLVQVLTCGSVDDGKSTLIGRLLWDATDLPEDTRATIEKSIGTDGLPDLSLLVDGLVAEREQGITIDIAWRYVDAGSRRYVIIDSPGHEQYTRNMATGASHADVAIMLIDARHGVKRQTRRHAAILDLMGVRRVVLAVNKMDLVDWSEARFREIEADFAGVMRRFGFEQAQAIPVAAKLGDCVACASEHMTWYTGPTLLDVLAAVPSRGTKTGGPFRFPVQLVLRGKGSDFRGLAGTVASGRVAVGDEVRDSSSGKTAKVRRIATMDGHLDSAAIGQAVVIQLDVDLDISRGSVLSQPGAAPVTARTLRSRMVWLAETPLTQHQGMLLRTATDLVPVSRLDIASRLDLETLAEEAVQTAHPNDVIAASITLARPVAVDRFAEIAETGSFILVDSLTGGTLAGGVVEDAMAGAKTATKGAFLLTRQMLAGGVCAGLDPAGAEFQRRADEVATILRAAGVTVEIER